MTFSEGVKFPKGWRVKLDPEALNMTSNSKGTNIVFSTKPLKGRQFHFIQLHIEVLIQQTTLHKNHNKAEHARLALTELGAGAVKTLFWFLRRL
ncbi:hypothetical protein [Listeria booriae]|uniref:hypothetical protein n=1 Tax=Listeria booriae TaxID=1552123 RepID=UPI00162AADF6|nr:hypothetical protein [Listeria booriae]MBC2162891.1 hypothetical protein [Listeria booriae]